MDKELLLYIAFLVIALLSRLLKKKKDNHPPKPTSSDETAKGPERALSFDELLKEFTGVGKPEGPGRPVSSQPGDEKPQHTYNEDKGEVKKTYDRSVREAKKLKTIDEQVDLNAPIKLEHFKGYAQGQKNPIASDILSSLQNTHDARRAIILGEILQRKY